MKQTVPLMIVPSHISSILSHYIYGFGTRVLRFYPGLTYDVENAGLHMNAGEYIARSLVNAVLIAGILFALVAGLKIGVNKDPISSSVGMAVGISVLVFLLYELILLRYPAIIAAKKAEDIDKNLLFAMKDLMLQVSSGVSLYDGFVSISRQNYGIVSTESTRLVRRVKTGTPMGVALELMGHETTSDYLRRTLLQLNNTLNAGGSVKGALQTVISELVVAQRAKIEGYAKELNLWSLVYMLFAVAIPSIGSTMLILLASFAGMGGDEGTFIVFIVITTCIQIAMIGLIKTRRPTVST